MFRVVLTILLTASCVNFLTAQTHTATWLSGSKIRNPNPVYGEKGVPHPDNSPGPRYGAATWIGANGHLYLYGGSRFSISGGSEFGFYNDIWRWDGVNWTWISGTSEQNSRSVYGVKGEAAAANTPGGRSPAATWVTANGDVYVFGGDGYDGQGIKTLLSDLWKWDGANWTWMGGPSEGRLNGVAGTLGVPDAANFPGARRESMAWLGPNEELYLFGGGGYDSEDYWGWLNDVWKWDGTYWTWVGGSKVNDQKSDYGTMGVAATSNMPSGRMAGALWVDDQGDVYIYGGFGISPNGGADRLTELWKWDGTYWTWVHGTQGYTEGNYGTKGVTSASNEPKARSHAVISYDQNTGDVFLFGGVNEFRERLNDLWRWDGTNWTWIGGDNTIQSGGTYGTQGTGGQSNIPGARRKPSSWTGTDGSFYIFGGSGYDSREEGGDLDDLWRISVPKTAQSLTFAAFEDKTYGDAPFTFGAESSSALSVGFYSSDTTVASISGSSITIKGAGTTVITASQFGDATYAPAVSVARTLQVAKASLMATADDQTREINLENPEFTISFEGFIGEEDEHVLDQLPEINTTALLESPRGEYPISLSGGSDDNYSLSFQDGVLTIIGPEFTLPDQIAFETTGIPFSNTESLEISNTGDGPLRITEIQMSTGYTVDQSDMIIAAGNSGMFTLIFSPTEPISYSGMMQLTTNDGPYEVPLRGMGMLVTSLDEERLSNAISIYPNPAGEFIMVEWSGAEEPESISLTDMQGRPMRFEQESVESNVKRLRFSGLSPGVYLMSFKTNQGKINKKIKVEY